MTPILMTEAAAREYLGGADPNKLIAPIRLGRGKWFSRLALDRAVKEKAGLPLGEEIGDENAYDAWKAGCA